MAIYSPPPCFKGRTFKLCVLNRWDFNFCICRSHCMCVKTKSYMDKVSSYLKQSSKLQWSTADKHIKVLTCFPHRMALFPGCLLVFWTHRYGAGGFSTARHATVGQTGQCPALESVCGSFPPISGQMRKHNLITMDVSCALSKVV